MITEKIDKIRGHEKFKGLDALFIIKPENVFYLLGFKILGTAFVILPKHGQMELYVESLEHDRVCSMVSRDESLSERVKIIEKPRGKPWWIHNQVKKKNYLKVGFEEEYLTVKEFESWKKRVKIDELTGASEILSEARMIKMPGELKRLKRAARIADIGFNAIYESIQTGMTEWELAAEAENVMRKAGSEGVSFEIIVATGERSAYHPPIPVTKKKVRDGDIVLIDIGARYGGYCSDMSRTFIHGRESEEAKKLIKFVNAGQVFALKIVSAGVTCQELARKVGGFLIFLNPEFGRSFLHGLGHGLGIDIHEQPFLSPLSNSVLRENMVITIEPGSYIPGLGGARTEDMVQVTKDGCRCLTNAPKFHY